MFKEQVERFSNQSVTMCGTEPGVPLFSRLKLRQSLSDRVSRNWTIRQLLSTEIGREVDGLRKLTDFLFTLYTN